MAEVKLSIEGMSCQHCVMAVKKAVGALGGVENSEVEIGSATVKFDDSVLNAGNIEAAIINAGYKIKK
jgi:copper chaperone